MGDHKKHPMRIVTGRTGLSPHVVRVWEKRYQAISPDRSKTNRRFYSEEDIERLNLLKWLTSHRHRIGKVAHLSLEELKKVAEKIPATTQKNPPDLNSFPEVAANLQEIFHNCLRAVEELDPAAFNNQFSGAKLTLAPLSFLEEFVRPLLLELSQEVRLGELRLYHYQMAWELIEPHMRRLIKSFETSDSAPLAVITAPSGHREEFSPLAAMTVTASSGWRNLYLGVNLPTEDIAEATNLIEPRILILAMSFSRKDPLFIRNLTRMRSLVPKDTLILIGGDDFSECTEELERLQILRYTQFSQLQSQLKDVFQTPPPPPQE